MLFIIDNYDSFTYNVVQAFYAFQTEITVVLNDQLTVQECLNQQPKAIVIGPGPGHPTQAGISLDLIHACAQRDIPVLGICLGMQAIGEAFGGIVSRANAPMHGKLSAITHDQAGIFAGLPQGFLVARYHSLVVDSAALPKDLVVSAYTQNQEIMALKHKTYSIQGVQFHPESIATQYGSQLLKNWLTEIGMLHL